MTDDFGDEQEDLDARELAIARRAAKLAVEDIAGEFYKAVGRGIVSRVLVWTGMIVVGWALASNVDVKGLLR